jgi:hypothetical protein
VLFLLSYIRKKGASGRSRTRTSAVQRARAMPLTLRRLDSVEPEGFEPSTTRRSIGFCVSNYQEPERGTLLPRAAAPSQVETAGVEPAPPRCKRGALPPELHPQVMRTGRFERPQREAAGLQPVELTRAQRPQDRAAGRIRTGTSRITTSDAAVTPQPPRTRSGDDRTRTGDLSPDKRLLLPLSYAPN